MIVGTNYPRGLPSSFLYVVDVVGRLRANGKLQLFPGRSINREKITNSSMLFAQCLIYRCDIITVL